MRNGSNLFTSQKDVCSKVFLLPDLFLILDLLPETLLVLRAHDKQALSLHLSQDSVDSVVDMHENSIIKHSISVRKSVRVFANPIKNIFKFECFKIEFSNL